MFRTLREKYDQELVKKVRRVEYLTKKVARHKNHRVFTLRCRDKGIVPPSLMLKCPINTQNARNIVNRAQSQLIRERIRVTTNKIKTWESDIEGQKNIIYDHIHGDQDAKQNIDLFISKTHNTVYEGCKERQKEKLKRFLSKKQETEPDLSGGLLKKWVINISQKVLSNEEESILSKGLNYAVSPQKVPVTDYIVQTEKACRLLPPEDRDSLRSEVVHICRSHKPSTPNITRAEREALVNLKKDDNIIILPADKGRATVIMDKENYVSKVNTMLNDTRTYDKLSKDPTPTYKKKLQTMLDKFKDDGKISESLHKHLSPDSQSQNTPRMYCTPKVHKAGTPLRPIVDYCGSINYNTSRYLADILNPLVGKNGHSVKNSREFVKEIKDMHIKEEEELCSFDVVSLFTNTPIEQALEVTARRLEKDSTLKKRTNLTVPDIMKLLQFTVTITYFAFQGQLFVQKFGTAMGSPVSPLIANLYMEALEEEAIRTAPIECRPRLWKRYVDDTLVIIKKGTSEQLLEHINQIDSTQSIKFTKEDEENRSIAFLDTKLEIKPEGNINIKVFRKATHTDQYLNFSSHHPVHQKLGVARTLIERCYDLVTDESDQKKELDHITSALKVCGYPHWTTTRVMEQLKQKESNIIKKKRRKDQGKEKSKGMIIIPYVAGLSERISRTMKKRNINTAKKPLQTLRNFIVHPKDKTEPKEGVYIIECGNCERVYIGETKRTLATRIKEHRDETEKISRNVHFTRGQRESTSDVRSKSAVTDHVIKENHVINWESAKIVKKESDWFARGVKEAITICQHKKNMNRDEGRFFLSPIYKPLIKDSQS